MTQERYEFLQENIEVSLTQEEVSQGYHFCPDYDMLLVGPGSPEVDTCTCDLEEYKKTIIE